MFLTKAKASRAILAILGKKNLKIKEMREPCVKGLAISTTDTATLPPTQRAVEIARLFSYFKNPDKETVLTPWRVVNMHMGNCLGGYNFYDEKYEREIDIEHETLRYIEQSEVTKEILSNKNAQILEINSKTGLYPLYVTYSIFRSKCPDIENTPVEEQRKLWNDTVQNNIYVICKTPMAKLITKRTLAGFDNIKINAHYFEDFINTIQHKPELFIEKIKKPNYWNKKDKQEMKFDAVVGNPPYQESMNGTSDKPVYHLFMSTAFNISDKVTFITPARFLFNAGKTPTDWNNMILNDEHFKVIYYTANSRNLFPNVDIKGGVAITYHDAKKDFGKIGIYSAFEELNHILKKVKKLTTQTLSDYVYAPESYKFSDEILLKILGLLID